MSQYRIIHAGQITVEADSEEDAYQKFWMLMHERIDEGRVGLITHIDGVEVDSEGEPCSSDSPR